MIGIIDYSGEKSYAVNNCHIAGVKCFSFLKCHSLLCVINATNNSNQ